MVYFPRPTLSVVALFVGPLLAFAQSPLEPRASLDTFCSRLSSTCAKECLARTGSAKELGIVCDTKKADYEFGCVCSDGTSIISPVLTGVTGLIASESITQVKTKVSTSSVPDTETITLSPVKTTSKRTTKTKFTTTKSTTVSAYQPPYFEGGNLRTAASAPFCSAYSTSCKAQCKSAGSSASANSCSRASTGKKSDLYTLECTCGKKDFTEAALGDVGKKGVKATSTSTSVLRTTTTTLTTAFATTTTFTAKTRTSTVRKTTTRSTAAKVTQTVGIYGPGRVRVDRTDRGLKDDTIGYISTETFSATPGTGDALAQLDPNADVAAPISLVLDTQDAKNVYALSQSRGAGRAPLYLAFAFPRPQSYNDHEIDNDPECDTIGRAVFNRTLNPFAPADFSSGSDEVQQSFSFTLGTSSLNRVNPDRKTQRELVPVYYTSDGTLFRPYSLYSYAGNSFGLTGFNTTDTSCPNQGEGYADEVKADIVYWFEPDPQ